MQEYEKAFKIKHIKTTSFHPQSNGSLERTHAVVKDMIRTTQKEKNEEWDEILNFCCLAYNTMVHESTGFTPFELTFGQLANLPSSIAADAQRSYADDVQIRKREWDGKLQQAFNALTKSKQRYQRDQNRRIIKSQTILSEGDRVLLHNDHKENKLDTEWLGPYTIVKCNTPYYEVLVDRTVRKIHGNRLKLYFPGRLQPSGSASRTV